MSRGQDEPVGGNVLAGASACLDVPRTKLITIKLATNAYQLTWDPSVGVWCISGADGRMLIQVPFAVLNDSGDIITTDVGRIA